MERVRFKTTVRLFFVQSQQPYHRDGRDDRRPASCDGRRERIRHYLGCQQLLPLREGDGATRGKFVNFVLLFERDSDNRGGYV